MTPKDSEINARAFIEKIVAINREYGMGVSQDSVEDAVEASAAVAKEVCRALEQEGAAEPQHA
jgi:hypothetical protein